MKIMRLLLALALLSWLLLPGCVEDSNDSPTDIIDEPTPANHEQQKPSHVTPPVAIPSCDLSGIVYSGDTIYCHGWRSKDEVDDDPIVTYRWDIRNAPTGASPIIMPPNKSETAITFDLPGDYILELIVQDPTQMSTPATVTVGVHPSNAYFTYNMNTDFGGYSCLFATNLREDEGGPYIEYSASTIGPDYVYYIGYNVSSLAYSPKHDLLYANSNSDIEKGITVIHLQSSKYLMPEGYYTYIIPTTTSIEEFLVGSYYDLIRLESSSSPYDLAVYDNNLLVVDNNNDMVRVFNLGNDGLFPLESGQIPVCHQPLKMEIDQNKIYVICRNGYSTGILNVIDAETLMLIDEVELGENTIGTVDIAIGGGKIFITNNTSRTISVIDQQTLELLTSFSAGSIPIGVSSINLYPYKLDYTNGKLYIGHNRGIGASAGVVAIFDATTYEYLKYVYTGRTTYDGTTEVKSDGYSNVFAASTCFEGITPIDLSTDSYIAGSYISLDSISVPTLAAQHCDPAKSDYEKYVSACGDFSTYLVGGAILMR